MISFIQHDFNPEDIPFSKLPTMSEAVLRTMLPDKEGKVFSANLHEGLFATYFTYFLLILYFAYFAYALANISVDREGW
jgi:hypothetical protein